MKMYLLYEREAKAQTRLRMHMRSLIWAFASRKYKDGREIFIGIKCKQLVPLDSCTSLFEEWIHGRIQRGDRGSGPPPLGKSQKIGFLSNTGPDSLKKHKATMPSFNVGPSLAR